MERDGIDRVEIPHGNVDLEYVYSAGANLSPFFTFEDMKDISDLDHLSVGDEIINQEIERNCREPTQLSLNLGNIIFNIGSRCSWTKPQIIEP